MRLTLSPALLTLLICVRVSQIAVGQKPGPRETDGGATNNEFLTRTKAIVKALPTYPAGALEQGAGSVESVRIGVTKEGEVFKVKVPPTMNPLFKDSVVDAVRQWKFRPVLMPSAHFNFYNYKLTFRFFIKSGKGLVELYNPPPDSVEREIMIRNAGADKEWKEWEEVPEKSTTTTRNTAGPR